ncbi:MULTISPECIES: EAL domain-containing protein [Pseudoalteromonas]|uniref:Two-component system response regulator n=1 Tax=Pseudoalteromonas amylolytica TaxID=1859457 RepID=A0A1S1MS61_9GAMM|nr:MULTISPECIES: EAL domain-containing protein [Pseudoalteromonas]OHU86205.1 two-component system response regulator [Pseudoalteromonas sp. JW3]OHU89689.1 two-component system response regulator [Pseudoalteromonas amylolytica]
MRLISETEFKPRILVVDDEPINLVVLAEVLKDCAQVDTCPSAKEAIKLAQQNSYHIVLLDIDMPELNGIEVCRALKSSERTAHSTVIFVTSHKDTEIEYEALTVGGIDFLRKPIDARLCQLRVQNHLKLKRQEAIIASAQRDIDDLVKQLSAYISYWDCELICQFCNDFDGSWFEKAARDVEGLSIDEGLPLILAQSIKAHIEYAQPELTYVLDITSLELVIQYVQVCITKRCVQNEVSGYLVTLTDISQVKAAELALDMERERLLVTLNSIGDAVIATDTNECVTFMNPIAERLTGWNVNDAKGKRIDTVMDLADATTKQKSFNPITLALQENRIVAMALNSQLTSLNGQLYRVEDSAAPIRNNNKEVIGAIIVFRDVSETIALSVKMSHLANYDQLTNLPNRILLHDRITQACRALTTQIAVYLIDIDQFKYINDSLGHYQGDAIIKQVAKRLESITEPNATLARVGGDEFVLLIPNAASSAYVDSVGVKIIEVMSIPFNTPSEEVTLTVSIGISMMPNDATTAEQLMTHADAAMYKAKERGHNLYSFYSEDIDKSLNDRHEMLRLIRKAIDHEDIDVFYQPKFELSTDRLIGAEALVRLKNDKGEFISPMSFIPLAEETGLINELGYLILLKSCRAAKQWAEKGYPITVAVNIAAKQFSDASFFEKVMNALENSGLKSRFLELEVTESALLHDFDETNTILSKLSELGLSIAIDDFGTGYSSLSYLKQLPVDVLKIDQSFVRDMLSDSQSLDIVKAIVQLARSLELEIVGEGIEEQAHKNKLIELGCHLGQGYLFSKPLPECEFEALLLTTNKPN